MQRVLRPVPAAVVICGVALVYATAARLALWMAIPPGYATAVWPAAGIGLVCVLVWRAPAAIGIALASCLVNLATSFDLSSNASSNGPLDGASIARSFALAAAIATGASAQAITGAWLIRRRIGFPCALHDERDIVAFVVLGGPVACLVSATVGVATLLATQVVPWSAAAFSWWTWWVGDTIGVLVFAPLALVALPASRAGWQRRRGIVGIPLALGFVVVTLLFLRVSTWESERLHSEFAQRAAPVAALLRSQLSRYEEVVMSLASYVDVAGDVSRRDFQRFCRRALGEHAAIAALSWNPLVRASDRTAFEERARADGYPAFHFTESAASGGLRITGRRDEHIPVYYIEPSQHAGVLGFDVASDPARLSAFERARRLGSLVASGRLDLIQDDPRNRRDGNAGSPDSFGVLMIAPVFAPVPGGLRGFTVGVLRIHELIATALAATRHEATAIRLIDREARGEARVLYAAGSAHPPANGDPSHGAIVDAWRRVFPLRLGDRDWDLVISPTPAFAAEQRSWLPWTVLAAGLVFVGLLGVVLMIITGRTYRLHESAERYRALVDEREALLVQLSGLNVELEQRVDARTSELSAALREREVLLQEIHHRVKNNLQVISSLINMQVRKLGNHADRDALQECQTRVQSIALIHEQLYRSRDYARVPFSDYTRTLVDTVFHTMGISRAAIKLDIAIGDVSVPVDKAIPCGLLLNELITNALKHAFRDRPTGTLRIELSRSADRVRLIVRDDGVGLPPDVDVRGSRSFGLQLVRMLVQQLDASLDVIRGNGTSFELEFVAG